MTRPALVTLVEKIVVLDKNTLQIHFTFRNEYKSVLDLIKATAKMNILTQEQFKDLPISIGGVV